MFYLLQRWRVLSEQPGIAPSVEQASSSSSSSQEQQHSLCLLTTIMTSRLRKEVQIFKEVYQHSRFGDHVEEVRQLPLC